MVPHGTRSRYVNHGCRCARCVAANSRYALAYLTKHREERRAYNTELQRKRRAKEA